MPHHQTRDAMHPVVLAALSRMGKAPDLVARCVADGSFVAMEESGAPTGIHRDAGRIRVTFRDGTTTVKVHLVSNPPRSACHSVDVLGATPPEAAVLAAAGRRLGEIVSIPGGDDLVVLSGRLDGGVASFILDPESAT